MKTNKMWAVALGVATAAVSASAVYATPVAHHTARVSVVAASDTTTKPDTTVKKDTTAKKDTTTKSK